ncbi:MAG: hypothetical protein ACKOQP_03175 [Bacteroidota bacterium]
MKTKELTKGMWTVSCEDSLLDSNKMWAVYSVTSTNELTEIASGIYNYQDAKAIQSLPEMIELLETFVMWYPEISEKLDDDECKILRLVVDRVIAILEK